MENNNIVLSNTTLQTIDELLNSKSVSELRKMAPKYGIKSASKYRRPVLVSLLADAIEQEYKARLAEEQAKQPKEKKSKKTPKEKQPKEKKTNTKAIKGSDAKPNGTKAIKGSNKAEDVENDVAQVIEYLDGRAHNDSPEYIKDALLVYGRQTLIRVMATYKIKGWYRIYNKYVMVEKLAEVVAA